MPLSTEMIRFQWENKNKFIMETKNSTEEWVKIIEVFENGNLVDLWPHIQEVCRIQMNVIIEKIGKEMKS